MNTNQDIFVVSRDALRLTALSDLISARFGSLYGVRKFNDNNSAVNAIDGNTAIIIFDNSIESENKQETLLTMKDSYPGIKVIMRTSNADIEMAIDDYCRRKSFHLFRKGRTWERLGTYIYNVTDPIIIFAKEFFVGKYIAVFLLIFILMGLGIFSVMTYLN